MILLTSYLILCVVCCCDDLQFGTRGNGGNANFIRTLEEKSTLYTQLSKFEKIDCIQQVITNWDGRFFILQADGSCCMVRDISPSSKLYTSVRRMMNYVVKKNELMGDRASNGGSKKKSSKKKQQQDKKKKTGTKQNLKKSYTPSSPPWEYLEPQETTTTVHEITPVKSIEIPMFNSSSGPCRLPPLKEIAFAREESQERSRRGPLNIVQWGHYDGEEKEEPQDGIHRIMELEMAAIATLMSFSSCEDRGEEQQL